MNVIAPLRNDDLQVALMSDEELQSEEQRRRQSSARQEGFQECNFIFTILFLF